jgi:hypothetical protein
MNTFSTLTERWTPTARFTGPTQSCSPKGKLYAAASSPILCASVTPPHHVGSVSAMLTARAASSSRCR